MESKFLVYTKPADVSGEPVGAVTAESNWHARHDVSRVMKIGYEIYLVQEGFGPAPARITGTWLVAEA